MLTPEDAVEAKTGNHMTMRRNGLHSAAAPAPHAAGSVRLPEAFRVGAVRKETPAAQDVSKKTRKRVNDLLSEAGKALAKGGHQRAEALYDEAMALLPEVPVVVWLARLLAAVKAENYDFVVEHYPSVHARAQTIDEFARLDTILIECLNATQLYEKAIDVAKSWSGRPNRFSSDIRSGHGIALGRMGRHEEATAVLQAALDDDPDHATTRWNLALQQLRLGIIPEAFVNYDARWELGYFPSTKRYFDQPRWQGEDLRGKRILVWGEQGVGDEIRFASLVPDLHEAGAEVTVECAPKLRELFSNAFPWAEVRRNGPADCRGNSSYEAFDFQTPVGSLARYLRPTVADFDARRRPWLKHYGGGRVREMIGAAPEQIVVGLCWRSSRRTLTRNRQYVEAEAFAALQLLGGVRFICLQYDECADECERLQALGLPLIRFADVDQKNDLVSAAHLASACDTVISAGTAVAELAAGLGIPTILFGGPNTQIQLGTDYIPWHPASRYISKSPGTPTDVARKIVMDWPEIVSWASGHAASDRPTRWDAAYNVAR